MHLGTCAHAHVQADIWSSGISTAPNSALFYMLPSTQFTTAAMFKDTCYLKCNYSRDTLTPFLEVWEYNSGRYMRQEPSFVVLVVESF